ncbi:DMT family transporter [Candidatus Bealeia paramacronuclearis]|uniref:DMT family transporter n=1 Tax=Candidatus Bealeia paramacronuclearis TaxID=1921001 RepID=A0ABZ2C355_9PROT|nr:DMT family transporter [Candidatus Bealeia paramacronuclearis]
MIQTRNPALEGAFWKIISCLAFAGINGFVHHLAHHSNALRLPPAELAFFESSFGLLFMMPWFFTHGLESLKTQHLKLYCLRAIAAAGGILLWFTSLKDLPLVQVIALKYLSPFLVLGGAYFFFRERLDTPRILAIVFAMGGAILITANDAIKPHPVYGCIFNWTLLLPVGAAVCIGISTLIAKQLAKTEKASTMSFYLLAFTMPIFFAISIPTWITPAPDQWGPLMIMGGLVALAYYALSRAFVVADLIYLIPLSFTRLIAAALIGMIFFDEWPTLLVGVGSFLILMASVGLYRSESHLKKVTP